MGRAYINRNEFRVVGMSRSGNHAVINWILAQAPGSVCFLNCAEPKTNPFHTTRPTGSGRLVLTNLRAFDLAEEQAGHFIQKDYLIISYEDCFLKMTCAGPFEQLHDQWVGSSDRRIEILILRDPFNLFASRSRFSYSEITPRTALRIWKQHARQFLGEQNYLNFPCVPIAFNRWVSSRRYRRKLAEQLGLDFTDAGFGSVCSTGGGSSFDGMTYDGRAEQMAVLDRWRHFADDPRYRGMFDAEILRLSDAVFGRLPGTETLRRDLKSSTRVAVQA